MAQMSEEELTDIISRDKPGFKVLKREPAANPGDLADAPPNSLGIDRIRDLRDLRERYLGTQESEADDAEGGGEAGEAEAMRDEGDPQDEIVIIGPEEGAADPWKPGPGPKSVVVSGKERRVVAEQG